MSGIDDLLAGNERFVATFSGGDLPIRPGKGTVLITCVDARIDPGRIFDLEPGDIFVLRSVGGRVTRNVRAQLGMVRALMTTVATEQELSIVVMHHTQCGTARFADAELRELAAEMAGVDGAEIDDAIVADPRVTVAADVAVLQSSAPEGSNIRGLVYDIATGVAIPV